MFTTTALELTIDDFRVALASVPWYRFKERRRLNKELKHYESRLEEAYKSSMIERSIANPKSTLGEKLLGTGAKIELEV